LSVRRRARRFLLVLAPAIVVTVFLFAGVIVEHVDPLTPADAIYVLGGSRISRALEAADLYHEHIAPKILISQGAREGVEGPLHARGIEVPTEGESARAVLVAHFDIPKDAVQLLSEDVDNTAQEADAVRALASREHWTRLVVITDCASTRRAAFAFRRVLGPSMTVLARCSRHDTYDPWQWWRSRLTFRQTFYELPKLVAYWVGLAG
jgi:uncharacterized SAM-binding protein YcdF (DUF218 family)